MAKQGVGNTALGAAICRLIEQYQPDETRLFNDPVVKDLVGAPLRFLMGFERMRNFTVKQTEAAAKGLYGAQVCRTRYIDDTVQAALSLGFDQVVILGAGFDTRPYRLPGMEGVKTFEVDLPEVQNVKKKRLQKHFSRLAERLPENVTFVPINFDTQALEDLFEGSAIQLAKFDTQILEATLAGKAFDNSWRTVFIWEGVTQYISEDAVHQTLAFVGKSAPGSLLIFTYVLKSIIERRSGIPGADKMMERVEKNNAPWIFGLDPASIQAALHPFHLTVTEDVGSRDYQEKYLQPVMRNMAVFEGERITQAIVSHS